MAGSGDSWAGTRTTYRALGPAGAIASIAGALCMVVVGYSLWRFSSSILGANTPAAAGAGDTKGQVAAHDAAFERYNAQFNGRSLFIIPGAPTPPAPPPPIQEDTKASKPTSYEGSPVIAMVLNTVWFADGKRLSVGDEPKDDTEVLEVLAPWDAILRWKGEKFTVSLFARDKLIVKPDEKPEASPGDAKPELITAAAPAKPTDPPKPDVSKPETKPEAKLADKPKTDKPPVPKSDAAPGTPAADPQPGGPEPDSNDRSPESGR